MVFRRLWCRRLPLFERSENISLNGHVSHIHFIYFLQKNLFDFKSKNFYKVLLENEL